MPKKMVLCRIWTLPNKRVMKRALMHFYLFAAASSMPLALYAAPENITPGTATLQCGNVRVEAQAYCVDAGDFPSQCLRQQIQLHIPATGATKLLPQGGTPITVSFVKEQKVLDAVVSSWACITAATGVQYILLLHTCKAGDEKQGSCAKGHGEFDSLFDLTGKPMTDGARAITSQRKKLNRQLGLSKIFADGVQMDGLEYLP